MPAPTRIAITDEHLMKMIKETFEGSPPGGGGNMEAVYEKLLDARFKSIDDKFELYEKRNEDRFNRIENDIKDIKSDLKRLPYWFIGTFVGMAAMVTGLIYFVHTSNQQFMSILVNALK